MSSVGHCRVYFSDRKQIIQEELDVPVSTREAQPNIDALTGIPSYREYETTEQRKPTQKRSLLSMWILPFTRMHRIPVFKRVWLYVAMMAAYTIAVDYIAAKSFPGHVLKEAGAAAYSSIILGMLLVFRTNSAYERWWEGRKQWGQLVNDSRNICIKVRSYSRVKDVEKARFGELIISFAYALKHHLRATAPSKPLPGTLDATELESQHLPVYLAGQVYDKLVTWQQGGNLDPLALMQLDRHARSLMDICGACERIKKSPIAVSYRAFMRQGIMLNLLILPWYAAQEFSFLLCLPLNLIATYFLVGLELIAEDIEDPFGYDGDDLPLDNICSDLRNSVSSILQVRRDQKFTCSISVPRLDPLKHL